MTTTTEPTQTSVRLEDGSVWIEGQLIQPPEGLTGPLVMGRDWLLEMIRTKTGIRVFFSGLRLPSFLISLKSIAF